LPDHSEELAEPWNRVSLIRQGDKKKLETWTCVALERDARNTFSEGESVRVLPDGNGIALTSAIPGNFLIANPRGFRFLDGVGIDVATQTAASVSNVRCIWQGMSIPSTSEIKGVRAAVSFHIPFALRHAEQRLHLKLIQGTQIQEYELGPNRIDSPGWYLLSLGKMPQTDAGDWQVELELVNVGSQFQTLDADATIDSNQVVPGQLMLLPWQRMKHGETTAIFPLRLGPICLCRNGGLAAVFESWTLNQWDANLSVAESTYWRDFDNSEEDLHGLVPTDAGVAVGTDSGVVAVVAPEGDATFLEKARTEKGPFDSRDGVTAIAVNQQRQIAAAGNLGGQIRMYDLSAGRGAPTFVTKAHRDRIEALAISQNGQRLASAGSDGTLRFWKCHTDRLELLFEMTANKIPIQKMTFSSDGDLYLLRRNYRAVLRLELDELASHFQNCGIQLPTEE
ncbi:MAG: WD40 repeat domain-containing protein, partial [Planctomycetaceae bacterium]